MRDGMSVMLCSFDQVSLGTIIGAASRLAEPHIFRSTRLLIHVKFFEIDVVAPLPWRSQEP